MKQISEVTVFVNGDSEDFSVFSNVPYFFTKTLIDKSIKVNRIDISASLFFELVYKLFIYPVVKLNNRKTIYSYFRSSLHTWDVNRRIKKALQDYPDADANVFLTFSFSSAGMSNQPVVLFGDWTLDHYFKKFSDRGPDYFERKAIKRESNYIERADCVITLFPEVNSYMKKTYSNPDIYYLGNVINALYVPEKEDLIAKKQQSMDLLFIGGNQYKEGAACLIASFQQLKKKYPDLKLHIIGLSEKDFQQVPQDIFFYGYLDKGKKEARELYYQLLKNAKIFINTTPKWGAFSATLEAMYFYTPVIVSPYSEFVNTFGENILFGYFCNENKSTVLSEKIEKVLNDTDYQHLCTEAHLSVKDFTWGNYIDKVIEKIREK